MRYPKTISLRFPILLFVILFFLVFTELFYVKEAAVTTHVDRIFYLIIHISFWLTTAFLFNSIVNKFYWGGLNKIPVGNFLLQKVKDFFSTAAYVAVIVILLVGYFDFDFGFNLVAVAIIAALLGAFVRQYLLCALRSVFLSNSVAFNIGDWVKLSAINSDTELIGEVDYVDRKNLKIKTENNNVVTISQTGLEEFVIENYWGSGKEARFEVSVNIDFTVNPKRVKRILKAAAKQAIEEYDILSSPPTQVRIKGISTSGIIYGIYFWIVPWEIIAPEDAKDKIIQTVLDHLNKSGLSLSYPKEDIYITQMPERQIKISSRDDVKKILEANELFTSLNDDELIEISETLKEHELSNGELVISQGDDGDSMFIVIEGLLDVFISSKDGSSIKVGRLTPGDYFGEMSLMTGEKRSATVTASTDVFLFEITKESISKIIERRESVINEFGRIIAERNELNVSLKEDYEKNKHNFFNDVIAKIKKFFSKK